MAYSTLPTVATGDLWTAANHNTYIKDNFAAGVPDIFSAKGDLAVGAGVDQALALGVGANSSILVPDSAQTVGLKWVPNYAGLIYRSTNQSITDNTWTKVQFDSAVFDYGSCFNVSSTYRFTAPITGVYLVNSAVHFYQNPTQGTARVGVGVAIYKNGSIYANTSHAEYGSGTLHLNCGIINTLMNLSASDYIEVWGLANDGNTGWAIYGSGYLVTYFGVNLVRAYA